MSNLSRINIYLIFLAFIIPIMLDLSFIDVNKQLWGHYLRSQFTTIVVFNYAISIDVRSTARHKTQTNKFSSSIRFLPKSETKPEGMFSARWQSKVNNKCQYLSRNFAIEIVSFYPPRINSLEDLKIGSLALLEERMATNSILFISI